MKLREIKKPAPNLQIEGSRSKCQNWFSIGKTFFDINHSNIFLSQSPKEKEIKAKINKWNLIKLISFCTAKETINKTKRQPMEWEKIFANEATDRGLISKMFKQLIQLNMKKQSNQNMGGGPK